MTVETIFDLCLYLGVWDTFSAAAVAIECREAGVPADERMIQAVIRQRVEAGEVRVATQLSDGTPVYTRAASRAGCVGVASVR